MFFGKKKETPEEKEARLNRIHAEMQQICDQGKDKYDKLALRFKQFWRQLISPASAI